MYGCARHGDRMRSETNMLTPARLRRDMEGPIRDAFFPWDPLCRLRAGDRSVAVARAMHVFPRGRDSDGATGDVVDSTIQERQVMEFIGFIRGMLPSFAQVANLSRVK